MRWVDRNPHTATSAIWVAVPVLMAAIYLGMKVI